LSLVTGTRGRAVTIGNLGREGGEGRTTEALAEVLDTGDGVTLLSASLDAKSWGHLGRRDVEADDGSGVLELGETSLGTPSSWQGVDWGRVGGGVFVKVEFRVTTTSLGLVTGTWKGALGGSGEGASSGEDVGTVAFGTVLDTTELEAVLLAERQTLGHGDRWVGVGERSESSSSGGLGVTSLGGPTGG
jgi:hypothetical protein